MNIIVLDFETFFSNEYTLSTSTTESYCRDPRFEAHGCAIKLAPDVPAIWYSQQQAPYLFRSIDWTNTFVIAHHMQFDGLILSHHYNVHPKMLGCTLSMARLLIGNHLSVSLESVRRHFGIPSKTTPYNLFKGKRWHELSPAVQYQIGEGAVDEVESIWKIFQILLKDFPLEELETVDTTLKMMTEPVLQADVNLLAEVWEQENQRKIQATEALGIDPSELQSAAKFQSLLEAEGVEIVYKDGKNGPIPALARTDSFIKDLLEDENPRVRALVEARIDAKSTLMQTRAQTLAEMANRGPLCMYLRYAGAITTRWSGGDSTNVQNLKRNSKLRQAIHAPEGFILAKPDLSQIEYRLACAISGQNDQLDRFRRGEDTYVVTASQFYGYAVNKKDHPTERQAGKIITLQGIYGSGGEKICRTLANANPPIKLTEKEGIVARDAFRATHTAVVRTWDEAEMVIRRMAAGNQEFDWGPLHIRGKRIYLPNGAPLIYDTLEWHIPTAEELDTAIERGEDEWRAAQPYWRYRTRNGWVKLYGSKLFENWCQALARVVISQAMIRIVRLGYRVVSSEHDSLWVLLPKSRALAHLETIKYEMRQSPPWLPGIPLEVECNDLVTEQAEAA